MGCRRKEDSQVCRHRICVFPGSGTRPPRAIQATARRTRRSAGWWGTDRARACLWRACRRTRFMGENSPKA
eukprot:1586551-Pyramimonas_sp.AAC.1